MVNKVAFDAILRRVCVLVLASIIFMNFLGLFKFLPPADAHAQIADASGQHLTSVTGNEGTSNYGLSAKKPSILQENLPNPRCAASAREVVQVTNKNYEVQSHDSSFQIYPEKATFRATATVTIKGRFMYYDDDGTPRPMRYVEVALMDHYYDPLIPDDNVATSCTDENGFYGFTVPPPSDFNPYVKCISALWWKEPGWAGEHVTVKYSNLWGRYELKLEQCGYHVPDGFDYDYGTQFPTTDNTDKTSGLPAPGPSRIWRILDNALDTHDYLWEQTGGERPPINMYYPEDKSITKYAFDYINLGTNCGSSTVYHEFGGHATMLTLYGLWDMPSWGIGEPDPHYMWSHSSKAFAFSEGWAEFMEDAVGSYVAKKRGDSNWTPNCESQSWYTQDAHPDVMDGDIVEGSTARILWDIIDPQNPSEGDYLERPYSDIFHILQLYEPQDILEFFAKWESLWPDLETSVGPLIQIFWNSGIDVAFAPPTGFILINNGAVYTTAELVTINPIWHHWGAPVTQVWLRNSPSEDWSIFALQNQVSWKLSSGDGTKQVWAKFVCGGVPLSDWDTYRWTSQERSTTITLDTSPPHGTIVIGEGNPAYTKSRQVTLYLTYQDPEPGSGVDRVRYKDEYGSWTAWELPSPIKEWILIGEAGPKTVYYQVRDNAGLIFDALPDSIDFTDAEVTHIFFNFNPNPAIAHDIIRLEGVLVGDRESAPLVECSVGVYYRLRDSDSVDWMPYQSLPTDDRGFFSATVSLGNGHYLFKANYSAEFDIIHFDCESMACLEVTLDKRVESLENNGVSIYFNLDPPIARGGDHVTLMGILFYTNPLVNNPLVAVSVSTDDGDSYVPKEGLPTNDHGIFELDITVYKSSITPPMLYRLEYEELRYVPPVQPILEIGNCTAYLIISPGKPSLPFLHHVFDDPRLWRVNPYVIPHEQEHGFNPHPRVCYVELSGEYNVNYIDTSTLMINHTLQLDPSLMSFGDVDGDLVPDLTVTLNSTMIYQFALSNGNIVGNVTLALTGRLYTGALFEEDIIIRIKMPGDVIADGKVDAKDVALAAAAFGSYPGHPRWDDWADENEDGKINVVDIAKICSKYGTKYL
jgi:hypothetical protein